MFNRLLVAAITAVVSIGSALPAPAGSDGRHRARPFVCGGYLRNSDSLDGNCRRHVDDVARILEKNPHLRLVVFGHQEPDEDEGVALRRAEAVRDYLVEWRNIEQTRLRIRSAGSSCATNRPGRSEEYRHVAIFLLGQSDSEERLEDYCRRRR
jgi:hypothetical protein